MEKKPLSIEATTIEVKVVKIANRKMTLSVFRQIPEDYRFIDANGNITGEIWGTVNIDTFDEEIKDHMLHVLWEKEGSLFRVKLPTPAFYMDKAIEWWKKPKFNRAAFGAYNYQKWENKAAYDREYKVWITEIHKQEHEFNSAFVENYCASVKKIEASPQLFIAV